jgi:hypothetical protein
MFFGLDFYVVLGLSREKSACLRTGNNVKKLKVYIVQEYSKKNVEVLLKNLTALAPV